MTNPLQEIESVAGAAAAGPWGIALKCLPWVIGGGMLIGAGWFLHGAFDGTKVAKVETRVAQTQLRCETARADANGAAAGGLAKGGAAAATAGRATDATETPRKSGYAAAQQEASHVPTNPTPAVCIDPEPLRQLLIGLRDADADAAAGHPDSGGVPAAAQHELPAPAVSR